MMFNKEIETLHIKKLRKLQSERLITLLQRLNKTSQFYAQNFKKKNIHLPSVKHIEEVNKLPFTMKTDLRENYPFGLFTTSLRDVTRIHCSSGSTGKSTVVGYTKKDIEIFAEVVARSLAASGAKPGMMLQNGYGYGLFTGGLGLHYGAEKLGLTVIPISVGNSLKQIEIIKDFKPDMISCTPSYAQTLSKRLKDLNIDKKDINLKFAVLGAEPWTEIIRKDIEEGLDVNATNIYGLSEIIGPGVSCEDVNEKGGSYIWEDHFYPEIIDPQTKDPLPEGKEGVLVLTTLTKEALPLVRYWTNDITSIYYDESGNRSMIKMGPIVGRTNDMLIIKGVNVYPTQIEACFDIFPELNLNYQLIVKKDDFLDELEVKVELYEKVVNKIEFADDKQDINKNESIINISNKLRKRIKELVGINVKVSLERENTLPKCEGGKLNRVIKL